MNSDKNKIRSFKKLLDLIDEIREKYDGIILAVAHKKFSKIDIKSLKNGSESIVFDLKGFFPRNQVDSRL